MPINKSDMINVFMRNPFCFYYSVAHANCPSRRKVWESNRRNKKGFEELAADLTVDPRISLFIFNPPLRAVDHFVVILNCSQADSMSCKRTLSP